MLAFSTLFLLFLENLIIALLTENKNFSLITLELLSAERGKITNWIMRKKNRLIKDMMLLLRD